MQRIQRRRCRGWRMPADAMYVGRPTRWGNPFPVAEHGAQEACRLFEEHLRSRPDLVAAAREALTGKRLACWCRLDQPCHADVWLEVLTGEGPRGQGVGPIRLRTLRGSQIKAPNA